jgi:hypothetical protein
MPVEGWHFPFLPAGGHHPILKAMRKLGSCEKQYDMVKTQTLVNKSEE